MIDNESDCGYNLPPGCFTEDIDRAYGGERRYCSECRHCIESDELDCHACGLKLKDALAELKGTQRWTPRYILAAVEDAVVDDGDCCADFEE